MRSLATATWQLKTEAAFGMLTHFASDASLLVTLINGCFLNRRLLNSINDLIKAKYISECHRYFWSDMCRIMQKVNVFLVIKRAWVVDNNDNTGTTKEKTSLPEASPLKVTSYTFIYIKNLFIFICILCLDPLSFACTQLEASHWVWVWVCNVKCGSIFNGNATFSLATWKMRDIKNAFYCWEIFFYFQFGYSTMMATISSSTVLSMILMCMQYE